MRGPLLSGGPMLASNGETHTAAADPLPIAVVPLSGFTGFTDDVSLKFKRKLHNQETEVLNVPDPGRMLVARITVQPGARFPWHTHPGPVVVHVVEGDQASGRGTHQRLQYLRHLSPSPATSRGAGLPHAAARNRGAEAALAAGAELLVFLGVDCMVATEALATYERAWCRTEGPALLGGPVAYLDPPADGYDYAVEELASVTPHPGRPAPPPGVVEPAADHRLFWSLSFALDADTWRTLGGFDEAYVGYGGEDTDFGQRAKALGVPMHWVGGAAAYHQWHPVSDPPLQHTSDLVRNANLFAERWGWWPMETWLADFEQQGVVCRTTDGTWRMCNDRAGGSVSTK